MALWSKGSAIALDLRAVHDPPFGCIERIAPVQRAAVVPEDQIAGLPHMFPCELRPGDNFPKLIEERFGLGQVQADEIRITPTAEIKHAASGLRMSAYKRMHGAL